MIPYEVPRCTRTAMGCLGVLLVLLGIGCICSQIPMYSYHLTYANASIGIIFGVMGFFCGFLAIVNGLKGSKNMLVGVLIMGIVTMMSSLGGSVSAIIFWVMDSYNALDDPFKDYDQIQYQVSSQVGLAQTILFVSQGLAALVLSAFAGATLYYRKPNNQNIAFAFSNATPHAHVPQPNGTQTIPTSQYPGNHVQFQTQPPHTYMYTDQEISYLQNGFNTQMQNGNIPSGYLPPEYSETDPMSIAPEYSEAKPI